MSPTPPLATPLLLLMVVVVMHGDAWCRWVKYEQTVETGGRWSKPHVSTTSMRGLNALRRAISEGQCCVSLDVVTDGEFDVAGQQRYDLFL